MNTRRALALISLSASLMGCPSPEPSTPGTDSGVRPDAATSDGAVLPGDDGGIITADGGGVDSGTVPGGWHAITLPGEGERVTGIYCTSPSACAVGTGGLGALAHLYATDSDTITATLLTADGAFGESVGVLGEPAFIGFSRVGDRVIARLDIGGSGFVSATGDITQPASWTTVRLGTVGGEGFALNAQYGFGSDGTRWTQFRSALVYETTDEPGPSASWDLIWSPQAIPPAPSDFSALRAADPTLCTSDPGYSQAPRPTGAAYVASDLGIVLSPANGLNQDTDDVTGICISTDGGRRFHLAPLPAHADVYGPISFTCTSSDHCVAAGGSIQSSSVYVYVSTNATMGAASTWARATIPSHTDGETFPSYVFFAPDGMHGWIAGEDDNDPLLWATTDGGATWTDATSLVRGLTTARLWSGFAIDATHVFIGGENGTLLASY